MDYLLTVFLWFCLALICLHMISSAAKSTRKSSHTKLPPGPVRLPIVGSLLFNLGKKPHEYLIQLANTYGPLMSFKIGSLTTVIVSSSTMAKEVLQKHGQSFSNRNILDGVTALNHHESSMVWLPVCHRWRNLRKISNSLMFATQTLDSNQDLRRQKFNDLISFVRQNSVSGSAIDIGEVAFTTVVNLISNTMFSMDLAALNSEPAREFKDLVGAVMKVSGKPNLADYFPMLRFMDLQGVRRSLASYFAMSDEFFDRMMNERLESRETRTSNDLLDTLLDISQQENGLGVGRPEIHALLKDFLFAGSHTTAITVEWAMAELIRNPHIMKKARLELDEIIGKDRPMEESDIVRLPYLQAIVKETFRLHPTVPFLVPRKAATDVKIHDFIVPKNAQVVINVFAIGRDPTVWTNPTCFIPERILGSEIDFKGQYFELIPFGSGRRICPALPLAHRMVHLMLGSLLHAFDWELEDGLKPDDMDVQGNFFFTLQKTSPLRAIPMDVK